MAKYIVESVTWLATALVISVGIYYTRNANCIWGMGFPVVSSIINRLIQL